VTPRPRHGLPGLFIAGTDTGVGKTTIAAALLRCARNRGLRLVPYKPVETGVGAFPQDAQLLLEAADPSPDSALDLASVCSYALRLPAAPQAAATQEGISISLDLIVASAKHLATLGDGLILESAGGLLVPYAPAIVGIDFAAILGLPVLLVARTGLGTINHTALSINELRSRRLVLAGLILVDTEPQRHPHEASNADLIEQTTGLRPLAVFPYLDLANRSPETLAQTMTNVMPPQELARLFALATGSSPAASDG
jgi:dethiobiotin synthetase